MNSFLLIFGKAVDCGGIIGWLRMLKIKMLTPNKPESKGNRGWLMFMFRIVKPRLPDNKKMIKARSFCFSFRIKNIDAAIKMKGMNCEING